MRIVTLNANGIRAAARKGFFKWLERQQADVVCLQEIKARADDLHDKIYYPAGFHCHYYSAQRPGYSGVAILSRERPSQQIHGLGWDDIDIEARYLELRYTDLAIVSLYVPSGTSGAVRQTFKMNFLQRFSDHLKTLKATVASIVICGDLNIAHKPIDLKNWRANQKNSGFLPEERAWLDVLFESIGYVDGFRVVDSAAERYTWWSNRGQAWANNTGWRLDYQIISPELQKQVLRAHIYTAERFSDHAPLIIDYRHPLPPESLALAPSGKR